jgi:ABC-type glycerol-3-phosphate transport system substrate-binding protein
LTQDRIACRSWRAISRRDALRLMLGFGPSLALAACAPPPSPDPTSHSTVGAKDGQLPAEQPLAPREIVGETLVLPSYEMGELEILVHRGIPEEVEARAGFNTWFQETHPGVLVDQQYLQTGLDYLDRLDTLMAADIGPDVFELWEWHVQSCALRGVSSNLDAILESDAQVSKGDLVSAALEGGSWQDSVYTFVIDFMPGPVSLYYNVDHFDDIGLDHPRLDWTWDDVRTAALALSIGEERWGLAFDTDFVQWLYWVWSNGGDVLNEEETACALSEPAATEAIQYWADLIHVDRAAMPSTALHEFQEHLGAFRAGAASMVLGGYQDVAQLEAAQEEGLNWGAVLAPRTNNGDRTWYGHFRGWAISPQASLPTTAWLYVRDFILNHTLGLSRIPSLKQLLPAFDNERNKELGYRPLVKLAAEPDLCRIPGYGFKWEPISQLIQTEMDHVFAGDAGAAAASAASALAVACARVDDELMDICARPHCP